MKRLVLSVCALGLLVGATAPVLAASGKVVIKIAGMKPEGEPETQGMYLFGKYLNQLSGNKYDVQVYPNSMLGKENKYIADTRRGVIQMCATGTQVSQFLPAMAMLETPMLFDSYDHAHRAMNGETFKIINEGFTKKSGLITLNAFPLGFRHFYSTKPITSVAEVQGWRMRSPNIPLYMTFVKNCGLSGQPMASAEVPSALDQGVIDGGDSPFSDIETQKMYEKARYITKTGHILVIHCLFINEKFFNKLDKQNQEWVKKAAYLAAEDVWKLAEEVDNKAIKTIESHGGKVSDPTPEFLAHVQQAGMKTWTMFTDPKSSQYAPNAQRIIDSANKYKTAK